MDLSVLASLDPSAVRQAFPPWLASRIGEPAASADALPRMQALIDAATDDEIRALLAALAEEGEDLRLFLADPLARRISRTWTPLLLAPGAVRGVEHLRAAGERVVVVCNHLSYVDSQCTDAILAGAGHVDLADRLVFVAGPKVYEDLFRRLAALCLTTLPAPQSTSIVGTERLSPRELARKALQAVQVAHDAVGTGKIVLVYGEGSRSRTGRLGPFLRGVWRYLDGVTVVPAAIEGTDAVFPIDAHRLCPARVSLAFGPPIRRDDPHAAVVAAHEAVAALLSEARRPAGDDPPVR